MRPIMRFPPTTTTANITAATVTVSGITANNKGYDGTTAATLNTAMPRSVGVVSGDNVTLNTASASGHSDSPDIGTGKTVTVSGLTLSGADAGNYTLVQPTTTADITLGTLTVTGITASNKVYDGTTDARSTPPVSPWPVSSPATMSTLDDSAITGSFDTKDAGTGKTVTITGLTLSGADAGKYTLVQPTTTARHHGGHGDRHRHHGERQGVRRHHRRDPRYHGCHVGRVSSRAMT